MKILNMSGFGFFEKFVEALDIAPGTSVQIITPQFERVDDVIIGEAPKTLEEFEALKTKTQLELTALGLRDWDGHGLMLLPYQWYDSIPEGFMLRCIDDSDEPFKKGVTDNDYRYGVLAYGIVPDYAKVQPS